MEVTMSTGGKMLLKREHQRVFRTIAKKFHDVEHFRVVEKNMHIAVVVLKDGRCFIGVSKVAKRDTYSRKIGHTMSVGRAMQYAGKYDADFVVNKKLIGRDLRDACRRHLVEVGMMEPYV